MSSTSSPIPPTLVARKTRVTPADLDAEIAAGHVEYTRLGGTITHCCITLANGFSVTGESACVDPANFDEAIGRDIAFKNAREKLWPLLGFRLADERLRAPQYLVSSELSPEDVVELLSSRPGLVVEMKTDTPPFALNWPGQNEGDGPVLGDAATLGG